MLIRKGLLWVGSELGNHPQQQVMVGLPRVGDGVGLITERLLLNVCSPASLTHPAGRDS